MKVVGAELHQQSSHFRLEERHTRLSVTARPNGAGLAADRDRVSLSTTGTPPASRSDTPGSDPHRLDDPRLEMLRLLLKKVFGVEVRLPDPDDTRPAPGPSTPRPAAPGPVLVIERYESHHEAEDTHWRVEGTIRTADGRTLTVQAELLMQRRFSQESHERLTIGAVEVQDPLVINFGSGAARLLPSRVAFDLTGDGVLEALPLLGPESGYLVLDREGQGQVRDGRDLFGPATGNGFAELARHDQDGNGWIDSGDEVFARLRVWVQSATGPGRLFTLAEKGVGAISLQPTATPFDLKAPGDPAWLGQVRSTSLFLRPDGTAGTVQQLDLSV